MAVRGKQHDLQSSSLVEQFEIQSLHGLSPRHVESSAAMLHCIGWCKVADVQKDFSAVTFFGLGPQDEGITIFEASVNI